ncbi:hypothetical protein IJM86_02805 [bacterium]|nr:hypothetical protein [bacterium]
MKLTVVDKFGKTAFIEKTINVESTLRPILVASPNAITFGKNISFEVTTNKTIMTYNWDF